MGQRGREALWERRVVRMVAVDPRDQRVLRPSSGQVAAAVRRCVASKLVERRAGSDGVVRELRLTKRGIGMLDPAEQAMVRLGASFSIPPSDLR